MPRLLTPLIILLFAPSLFAQSDEYHLHLESRPGVPIVRESSPQVTESELVDGYYYRLVQFHELPGPSTRNALRAEGIRFLSYLPGKAYYLAVPAEQKDLTNSLPGMRANLRITSDYKLDPELLQEPLPEYALTEDGVKVNTTFFSNLPLERVRAIIEQNGWHCERLSPYGHVATIVIPKEQFQVLADHPAVQYIELVSPPGEPENYNSAVINRSALLNGTSHSPRKYDGAGTHVQLQDDGFVGPHIDHKNRIREQFVSGDFGNHGDHTAGTIFGAGNRYPLARGMAPGAQLYVYNYDEFNDSITSHHDRYGINISSTSYSNGCNDGYTATARTHDMHVQQFPDLTHVFSSGNSNGQDCDYGAGSQWGNVTGGHKVGKNVLAVANTDNAGDIASSSSRGPAHDGRIKPDISAKGTSVLSTTRNNNYDANTGTSMSCPAVAGGIALLYHAYRENNSGAEPPSALIKSHLLNTATDLGNRGPDFIYGWGMMNTFAAAGLIKEDSHIADSLEHLETDTFTVEVPDNAAEARIMLYWHDVPAAAGASKALVNDLDLKVVSPNGDTLLPLVPNSHPHPDSLDQPARPGEDHLNNMEQVLIDLPEAGTYEILVEGTEVPEGSQKFFISSYFPARGIDLIYPNGGEGIAPQDEVVVSWESFAKNDTALALHYSADSGNTWEQIANQISNDVLSYEWNVPSGLSGNLLFKASAGSYQDVSDSFFTVIGTPESLEITRVCCESFELSWSALAPADSYTVYLLDSLYMQPIGTTTATSYDISEYSNDEDVWVTVSAHAGGGEGRRALAIQKPEEAFGCDQAGNIALSQISSPGNGIISPCIYGDSLPVQLTITNYGQEPVDGAMLTYSYKGQTFTYEHDDTIPAEGEVKVSFPQRIAVPPVGDHILSAWIANPMDVNICDDTATIRFRVVPETTVTVPYSEDLEGNLPCNEFPNCEVTNCSLLRGLINAPNTTADDIDWRVDQAGTATDFSGPSIDHNPGSFSGKYVYLEASGGCTGQTAILQLPCMDLTNLEEPHFRFWYHMYGADMGSLSLQANDGSGWNELVKLIGNEGNFWRAQTIDLSAYAGDLVVLRFVGVTGIGIASDMALDDFSLFDDVAIEATIKATDTVCRNETFEVSADINTVVASAEWQFGEGATPSSAGTLDPVEVSYADTGTKEITLKLVRPRDSITVVRTVYVRQPPQADFEYYQQGRQSIQFVNRSEGASQFQWHFGDGDTSHARAPFHQYADTAQKQVTLIAGQGVCSHSVTREVTLVRASGEEIMLLYPNPANDRVNVRFISPEVRSARLQLIDAAGKVLWDQNVEGIELNAVELDVAEFAAGIYFLKAIVNEQEYLNKFIITKD